MNEICFFTVSLRSCIVYFESTELKNTKSSSNWLQCSLWFVYCNCFALISNDIHSTFISVWRHYEKELKTPCWLDCQLQIAFVLKYLGRVLLSDYSGMRIHGIGGNCVLLGPILIPE